MNTMMRILVHEFFLVILLFTGSCDSEKAPYSSFAHDATKAPPKASYDYIVIGGGTSGCALAATLTEHAKVLLLERGDLPYGHPMVNNFTTFAAVLNDNSPTSPQQKFISTDGVVNSRARVLGGGTAINAGFYTRASTNFLDRAGWDRRLVNKSYEWVEKKLVSRPRLVEWQSTLKDGLLEAGVLPFNGFMYDHIIGTKIGGTIFEPSGRRHSAADLLEYADPAQIIVYVNATVQKIIFKTQGEPIPRATGVEFKDSRGGTHTAYLNVGTKNEVILSAGTLGSPQLLMISGIGPQAHLKAHGIDVLMDQPMVGQGLADNPLNGLIVPSRQPVELSLLQVVGITRFGSFIESASGTQFGYIPVRRVAEYFRRIKNQTGNSPRAQAGVIIEKVKGPLSKGFLELQTRDPNDNPRVTFNYFQHPKDLQTCVRGMKTIIKVINSHPFSKFLYPGVPIKSLMRIMMRLPINKRPRYNGTRISLKQYCTSTVMTMWHYHGGCLVGKVVDKDYKVIGVGGLRVIDGSTLDRSPGVTPQATIMMLGRYMGQKIVEERSQQE